MPSRAPNREEEFELVLGNKQLLSLFFIVVGFFAAFFSVGYMVGFGHGEKTGADAGIAQVEEPAPQPAEPRLPATLMQDPLAPPPVTPPAEEAKPSPAVQTPEPKPAPAQKAEAPKPKQTVPEKPSPTASSAPAAKSTSKPAVKPAPTPAATTTSASGSYYLQVAAVRVQSDAVQLAGKLKSKGYPATVNAGKGDGWQRVVVGPFQSPEAASSFKAKLTKDGFDTMLRKL